MADKSLDELYIEIETKSEKAESKIDDLIQDLTKLKSALNGINDTGLQFLRVKQALAVFRHQARKLNVQQVLLID